MQNTENILIVRTDRVGDVVLTLPMIDMVKRNDPEAKIHMLIREYTSDLVKGNKMIESYIIYDKLGSFFEGVKRIRKLKINKTFIVSPGFKLALMLFMAGIKKRIGTAYRWYSFLFNIRIFEHRKYAQKHELEFNLNMLKSVHYDVFQEINFNIPIFPDDEHKVNSVLESIGIGKEEKFVIIHPGSGGSSIDLPKSKVIELANLLIKENVNVILSGGKGEEVLIEEISKSLVRKPVSLVNIFNLRELAAFLKRGSLFISNSTGPIHIAAAVGTFVVGFYPPVIACSEKRWGPYTEKKIIFSPKIDVNCSKCTYEKCKYFECMDKIPVNEVFNSIKKVLTI